MKLTLLLLTVFALGGISALLRIGLGVLSKNAVEQPTAKAKPQEPDNSINLMRVPGAILYTVIFALLLGIKNLQTTPLLWGFLATFFVFRLAEAFTPAANMLKSYRKEEDQSRWTTWIISISFVTNLVFPMWEYRHGLKIFINFLLPTLEYSGRETLPPTYWWNWVGLLLLIAGSTLRLWAIQQAGAAFIPHVKVDSKHKLVTAGPYAYMRHPSYLGTLLSYLGITVLFGSVIGALALALLVIPAMIFRSIKEEQLLSQRFGEAWKNYQSQTPWRLIPRVW
ncbi:MAG: methyltransferase family protein [bacterium]